MVELNPSSTSRRRGDRGPEKESSWRSSAARHVELQSAGQRRGRQGSSGKTGEMMASVFDRNDGEMASSWLNRLDGVDESVLDASELSDLQALRRQAAQDTAREAGDQIECWRVRSRF